MSLGGKVQIHGRRLADAFLRTSQEPLSGQNVVRVESSALTAGWRTGDRVVVVGSSQCMRESGDPCNNESEDRTITAISPDGLSLTLSAPLQRNHPGVKDRTGVMRRLPHILNEERNVIIRSESPQGIRGHMLFHGRPDIDIRFARLDHLGRTNNQDLGAGNQKGRYPLHMHHLIGPRNPQPNGYQFTLVGNVVHFGTENASQNRKWGIAVHGSHYGLIAQNIVDYASGSAVVLEDASEIGNRFVENFVVRLIGGNGVRGSDNDPSDNSKLGRSGVAYWFNGGGGNSFQYNVAAEVAPNAFGYGFKFDNVYNGTVTLPISQGADPHMGAEGVDVDSFTIGIEDFVGNETYRVPNGFTPWWYCAEFNTPKANCSSLIKDFTSWNHYGWAVYLYETHNMTIDGLLALGTEANARGYETMRGFTQSDYMQSNLVIKNCTIHGLKSAIDVPSHVGEGATQAGVLLVENCDISANGPVTIPPPGSTNGATHLKRILPVFRNVRFYRPSISVANGWEWSTFTFTDSISGASYDLSREMKAVVENYSNLSGASLPVTFDIYPLFKPRPPGCTESSTFPEIKARVCNVR